jgi:hypothetical protein
MISIVQLRKSFPISSALVFVGAMLALFLSFGTSAQNQTLFADDFEDGNANGWTKSGGSWSDSDSDSDSNADSNSNSNPDAYSSASRRSVHRARVVERRRDRLLLCLPESREDDTHRPFRRGHFGLCEIGGAWR